MFTTLIVSALSAGCGACLGAIVAFKISCRKEEKLQRRESSGIRYAVAELWNKPYTNADAYGTCAR